MSKLIYGLTVKNTYSDHMLHSLCQELFHSTYDIETAIDILNQINSDEEIQVLLDEFDSLVIERNFTNFERVTLNYDSAGKAFKRIKDWNTKIGILSDSEIRMFLAVNHLNVEKLLPKVHRMLRLSQIDSPKQIFDELSQVVVGQNKAKKSIAVELYSHLKRLDLFENGSNNMLQRNNLLFKGPSGSGKTFIVQESAKLLGLPFIKIDAASLVKSGIVGNSIKDYFQTALLRHGEEDLAFSIVFIDEFDKISSRYNHNNLAIQTELLSIVGEYGSVNIGKDMKDAKKEISTENMLFVFGGAFQHLHNKTLDIGFNKTVNHHVEAIGVSRKQIIEFGFIEELINRISKIVELHPLDEESIRSLLFKKSSPLNPYIRYFEMHNTDLKFSSDFINKLVYLIKDSKQNTRAINSILSNCLEEIMFENTTNEKEIIVDASYLK